jgi:hypothetical protein
MTSHPDDGGCQVIKIPDGIIDQQFLQVIDIDPGEQGHEQYHHGTGQDGQLLNQRKSAW